MRTRSFPVAVLSFLALVPIMPVVGLAVQSEARRVSGAPVCPTCTVEVRKLFTLGSPGDPMLLREYFPDVVVDPFGNFVVSAADGAFVVFDSSGKFRSGAGRMGWGPGEFGRGSVGIFSMSPDTTFVIGASSVLNLNRGWEERNRFEIPSFRVGGRSMLMLANGLFVYAGNELHRDRTQSGPDTNRITIQVFGPDKHQHAWMVSQVMRSDFCLSCEVITLANAAARDEFWALGAKEYRLQRWRADGTLRETVTVAGSPWYTRWIAVTSAPPPPNRRWAPIMNARLRSDGRLLVGAVGPAPNYYRVNPNDYAPAGRTAMEHIVKAGDRLSTAFDVIDLNRGVLASTVLENTDIRLISGEYGIRYALHPSGIVQVEVWRVDFRER